MSLKKHLVQKKAAITDKWFELVVNSYPPDTSHFLHKNRDPFANPVGENTRQNLEILFDLIAGDYDAEKARTAMDTIIRMRAIQDFTPAAAVRFVLDLKPVIQKTLGDKYRAASFSDAWTDLERRIDELALSAFDIYVQCREKIYDLKANETRSRIFKAFAKAGLIKEPADDI